MKRLLPTLVLLLALSARAEEAAPAPIAPEERKELLDRAKALRTEAAKQKSAAGKKQKEADTACWKEILVSACLQDARREYLDGMAAARAKEVEAKRLEREVRIRDRATRQAKQAEEAPQKQAADDRKIAKVKEKEAEEQGKREDKAAAREKKAEQGSARAREEERRRLEKIEARRKKERKAEEKALEREKKDRKREEERARQLEQARQPENRR
jgi:hypothetical protein